LSAARQRRRATAARGTEPLRVLIVEHTPADAELMVLELERAGFAVQADVTDTPAAFSAALTAHRYDVVLSDYRLPQWTAMDALALLRRRGDDTPLIIVTGTLGDERAVDCVREGASDYVIKQHLPRLPVAVRRALEGRALRAAQQASEERYRLLFESIPLPVWVFDLDSHHILAVNEAAVRHYGYAREEFLALRIEDLRPPEDIPSLHKHLERLPAALHSAGKWRHRKKDGTVMVVEITAHPLTWEGKHAELVVANDITADEQAERALQEREERFRQLAENIEEVFFVMDAQYRETLYISPAYETIWGRTCRSLYEDPRSFFEPIIPADREPLLASILRIQAGEDPGKVEYRVVRPDGAVRWILSHAIPIRDDRGEVYRISGVALDVTERKRAEGALRASEEQFRLLLNSTAEGIYGLDVNGRCTFCNPAAARLLGYERSDELFGKKVHALMHHTRADGSPYPQEECLIYQAFRRGEGTHVEDEVFWRADGTSIPVEYWSYPIRKGGEVVGAVVTFVDVTERRRAQAALEESEARFRKLTEASFDGIDIVVEGVIQEANQGFADMFGCTVEEAIGRPATDFVADESLEDVRHRIAEGTEGTYELVGKRKDGRKIMLEATAKTHTIGGRQGHITALRDVTEQRSLEQQYRQAQKMEAVGRLAGGVAHDFNNVLTAIFGYTDLVLEDLPPDSSARQDLGEIRKAAQRAAALTRQLLAFSRQQVLEPVVLNLNEVVEDIDKMLHRLLGEDVELTLALAPDLGNTQVDPGQLQQVLLNLAVNSRDAMPTGGKLMIETANTELTEQYAEMHQPVAPGPYVMLAVSDTGSGMSPEIKAKIFEPFFTTKEKGRGTGLGLSTVYGIVKQSGGFIWVYSEPGQGTTFKIYLPRVDAPAEPLGAPREAGTLAGTETILLAEDDDMLRPLARGLLERLGYTVLEAENAERAVSVAGAHVGPIHLLVADVVMPGASGRELARRLAQSRPDTKVLYISGYTDDAIVHHGMLEPGLTFLQKPFTPAALARKVREVLDGSSRT
jgi:two-component system, cell cycle sensor histidine kinase and response regulator CckA